MLLPAYAYCFVWLCRCTVVSHIRTYNYNPFLADPKETSLRKRLNCKRISSRCTGTFRVSVCVAVGFVILLAVGTAAGVIVYATLPVSFNTNYARMALICSFIVLLFDVQCGPVNRSLPQIVKSAENGETGNVQRILKTDKGSVNQQSCVRQKCMNIFYN